MTAAEPRPKRLVVADDHADTRALVRHVAAGIGMVVVAEAADGAEADAAAAAHEPDVVVMDWNMPVLDGAAATRAIRRDRPRTAVVGHSAADAEAREAFAAAGADAFVPKGDIAALADALTRVTR